MWSVRIIRLFHATLSSAARIRREGFCIYLEGEWRFDSASGDSSFVI